MRKLLLFGSVLLVMSCLCVGAPQTGDTAKAAATEKTYTGTISDDMCGAKHSKSGPESAECVAKCVKGGSKYVLVSIGKVYKLDPQDKFADLAGKRVAVTGTRNGDTITVASVKEVPTKASKAAPAAKPGS